MIKFGVRSYLADPTTYLTKDRIVAYTMDDKEISFDEDMSSHVGTAVMIFWFNELGQMTRKCIAELKSIKKKFDEQARWDTWEIEIATYPDTVINMVNVYEQ